MAFSLFTRLWIILGKEFPITHPFLTKILRLMIKRLLLLFLFGYPPCNTRAQGAGFTTWNTIDRPIFITHATDPVASIFLSASPSNPSLNLHFLARPQLVPPRLSVSPATGKLLPEWHSEALPFFCRVEHDWGKKLPFAFKFRLGSVEYVDWLEGKSVWISP